MLVGLYLDTGEHYDRAARAAKYSLDSDMSGLVDWNNSIYADLMADDLKIAQAKWDRVAKRPAWGKALEFAYYIRATHGLLLLRRGDLKEGKAEYEAASRIASGAIAKQRILQKLDPELGRELVRSGSSAAAVGHLRTAAEGHDALFAREARQLLKRCSGPEARSIPGLSLSHYGVPTHRGAVLRSSSGVNQPRRAGPPLKPIR